MADDVFVLLLGRVVVAVEFLLVVLLFFALLVLLAILLAILLVAVYGFGTSVGEKNDSVTDANGDGRQGRRNHGLIPHRVHFDKAVKPVAHEKKEECHVVGTQCPPGDDAHFFCVQSAVAFAEKPVVAHNLQVGGDDHRGKAQAKRDATGGEKRLHRRKQAAVALHLVCDGFRSADVRQGHKRAALAALLARGVEHHIDDIRAKRDQIVGQKTAAHGDLAPDGLDLGQKRGILERGGGPYLCGGGGGTQALCLFLRSPSDAPCAHVDVQDRGREYDKRDCSGRQWPHEKSLRSHGVGVLGNISYVSYGIGIVVVLRRVVHLGTKEMKR